MTRDIRDGIKDFTCNLNQNYDVSIDTLHTALHDVFDWLDELWCKIFLDRVIKGD